MWSNVCEFSQWVEQKLAKQQRGWGDLWLLRFHLEGRSHLRNQRSHHVSGRRWFFCAFDLSPCRRRRVVESISSKACSREERWSRIDGFELVQPVKEVLSNQLWSRLCGTGCWSAEVGSRKPTRPSPAEKLTRTHPVGKTKTRKMRENFMRHGTLKKLSRKLNM